MYNEGHAPMVTAGYLLQIEDARREQRLTQKTVAARAGFDRATWTRVAGGKARDQEGGKGVARPYFDTVAAMARAVGKTFALVDVDVDAPDFASLPRPTVYRGTGKILGPGYEQVKEASEASREFMARLRATRRAAGIMLKDMRKRLSMSEFRLSEIERGRREPRLGDVLAHVRETGHVVEIVAPEAVPLARLDAGQADAVTRLVTSYVAHCAREGRPVPPSLLEAAASLPGKLDNTTQRAA